MKHYFPISAFGLAFIIGATPVRLSSEIKNVPADYRTIQQAIDAAATGDTVLVAEGSYFENLQITSKSITLCSHFLIDGDTSHIPKTIIDGSQPQNTDQASVIRVRWSQTTTVISGLTITGGYGTKTPLGDRTGGGINAVRSSITVSDCRIIRNIICRTRVPDTYAEASGGGISVSPFEYENPSITIRNNLVSDNYAEGYMPAGGGIFLCPDRPGSITLVIENNVIRNNITQNTSEWKAMGGGIFLSLYLPTSGEQIIRNNIFSDNQARCLCSFGGAMYVLLRESIPDGSVDNDPGPYIFNNIFSGNHSDHLGGAIAVWRVYWPIGDVRAWALTSAGHYTPKPSFVNNTFADNSARDGSAFYIMNHKPLLMNNILWDSLAENAVWGEIFLGNDSVWTSWVEGNTYGDAEVHYTDIQGGWNKGTGNLNADPLFLDSTYRLSDSSPCIGAGVDSLQIGGVWCRAPDTCFYGSMRPDPAGSKPDIGACEDPRAKPLVEVGNLVRPIPARFMLQQNYPNPFNPTTTIRYELPRSSEVRLSVFDILGREVSVLVNERRDTGVHEIKFDGSGLPSGVYLYRLTAGSFVETRKLLLVR